MESLFMAQLDEVRNAYDARRPTNISDIGEEAQQDAESSSTIVRINETLRLGHVMSLFPNSAGPQQARATDYWLAIEVAAYVGLQHFNRRHFPFDDTLKERIGDCDLHLTVEFRDTKFSPIRAGRHMQDVFFAPSDEQIRPTAIVGPLTSSVSDIVGTLGGLTGAASSGITEQDRATPVVSGTAASSRLDNKGVYPYFARTIATNAGMAMALCANFKRIGVINIGIVHVRDSWGTAYMTDLENAADSFGISYVKTSYTSGIVEELSTAADFLVDSGMKYFVGICYASEYERVILKLHEKELIGRPDMIWYFNSFVELRHRVFDRNIPEDMILAKALNGSGAVALHVSPESQQRLTQIFEEEFQNDRREIQYYASKHRGGGNLTAWQPNLQASWPSVVVYDAAMAIGIAACSAASDRFTGPELYNSIKSAGFEGASGEVTFDNVTGTRSPESLGYMIFNLVIEECSDQSDILLPRIIESSLVYGGADVIEVEQFIYPDGTVSPPRSLEDVEENMNLVKIGVRSAVWTIAALVMFLVLFCASWTVRFRRKSIVKKSQPFFLLMICAGAFILALSILPATLQEPTSQEILDAACMMQPWLFSIGLTVAFAAIFSKVWRIYKVFEHAKGFRRIEVKPKDVLLPFLGLFIANVAVLTAWTIDAPLQWARVPVSFDVYGRVVESYGTCYGPEKGHRPWYFYTALVINIGALLVANYQSYRAKDLPPIFNESVPLILTNFLLLEILLLGFPVLVVVSDDPTAFLFIDSMVVALLCLAVILPMFLRLWYRNKTPNTNDNNFTSSLMSRSSARRRASRFSHNQLRPASRFATQRAEAQSDRTAMADTSSRPKNSFT